MQGGPERKSRRRHRNPARRQITRWWQDHEFEVLAVAVGLAALLLGMLVLTRPAD